MIFMKTFGALIVAAFINGATHWSYAFAQAADMPQSILDIIQLGGTGGLILALLVAVYVMWKEREVFRKELAEERKIYRDDIERIRTDNKEALDRIQANHQQEIDRITDRYTRELKEQIELLRNQKNGNGGNPLIPPTGS